MVLAPAARGGCLGMTFAPRGSASVYGQHALVWLVAFPGGAVSGPCFALVRSADTAMRYCALPLLLHAHSPSTIRPTCAGIVGALRGEVVACEPRAEPLWEAVASARAGKVPGSVALGGEGADTGPALSGGPGPVSMATPGG